MKTPNHWLWDLCPHTRPEINIITVPVPPPKNEPRTKIRYAHITATAPDGTVHTCRNVRQAAELARSNAGTVRACILSGSATLKGWRFTAQAALRGKPVIIIHPDGSRTMHPSRAQAAAAAGICTRRLGELAGTGRADAKGRRYRYAA